MLSSILPSPRGQIRGLIYFGLATIACPVIWLVEKLDGELKSVLAGERNNPIHVDIVD